MENGRSPSANRTILPPPPFLGIDELGKWSLYRATMTEFVATFLFLYVLVSTVIGYGHETDLRTFPNGSCSSVGLQGIAWAVGGMIFVLVYCTAGISGGHINPAVTFGLFLGRKVPLIRALFYILAQVGGAICGAGLVKGLQKDLFNRYGGATNGVNNGYSLGTALGAEIVGTFILVFTVFSATDEKRRARDSYVPILAPLPIGFSVFVVHLATLPITGTSINPARSLGAAVMFNKEKAWNEQWIFCVGPLIGAAAAAIYYEHILKASVLKTMTSFKRNSITDGA